MQVSFERARFLVVTSSGNLSHPDSLLIPQKVDESRRYKERSHYAVSLNWQTVNNVSWRREKRSLASFHLHWNCTWSLPVLEGVVENSIGKP